MDDEPLRFHFHVIVYIYICSSLNIRTRRVVLTQCLLKQRYEDPVTFLDSREKTDRIAAQSILDIQVFTQSLLATVKYDVQFMRIISEEWTLISQALEITSIFTVSCSRSTPIYCLHISEIPLDLLSMSALLNINQNRNSCTGT